MDSGVVSQILADAGQVAHDWNSKAREVVGGANAGQHQDMWGTDSARAKYDFFTVDRELLAAAFCLYANGSVTFE